MPPQLPDPDILAGHLAPRSLTEYRRDAAAYLRFCGDAATALDAACLARWRTHLALGTTLSPNTINRKLAAIKRLVSTGAEQGYLDAATAQAFAAVAPVKPAALKHRLKPHARTPISPADMRRLCEAPSSSTPVGLRDRALLATLASSGCRVSEVTGLALAQVHAGEGYFYVEVLGKNQTNPRPAPLSQEAYACIQAWLARRSVENPVESPYVFTSFAGRGSRITSAPLSIVSAWRLVQRYAADVGLRHAKPHDFRRFVGTETARKHGIREAQKILGHKRIETTARHYVLDELTGGLTDGLY